MFAIPSNALIEDFLLRFIAECHDDVWGGKDANGLRWPEDHWETVWEWQRRSDRDNQEQDQKERECKTYFS